MGFKTAIATEILFFFLVTRFRPVEAFGLRFRRSGAPAATAAAAAAVPAPVGYDRSAFEQLRRVPLLASCVLKRTGELLHDEGFAPKNEAAATFSEIALYAAVLLLAPPLAAAREVALSTQHLLRRPVTHARGLARSTYNSLKYVAYVTSRGEPVPRRRRVAAGDYRRARPAVAPARAAPERAGRLVPQS